MESTQQTGYLSLVFFTQCHSFNGFKVLLPLLAIATTNAVAATAVGLYLTGLEFCS